MRLGSLGTPPRGEQFTSLQMRVEPLEYMTSQSHRKLSPQDTILMRAQVERLHNITGGNLIISSLLSGSDVQYLVWLCLAKHWEQMFGIHLEVQLSLACDNKPCIQRWLSRYSKPGVIFPDVHLLGTSAAKDIDDLMSAVIGGHHTTFGIECDTLSMLSSGWSDRLDCVDRNEGRTGRTAISCLEFVFSSEVPSWLAECVKNLNVKDSKTGIAPSDTIKQKANMKGYLVYTGDFNSEDQGPKQSRPRFWMYGSFVGVMSMKQQEKDFEMPAWLERLGSIVAQLRLESIPISAYLLDEADDRVQEVLGVDAKVPPSNTGDSGGGRQSKRRKLGGVGDAAATKVEQYEIDHLEVFQEAGLQWPPQFDPVFEKKVAILGGKTRAKQLLWLDMHKEPTSSLTTLIVRDVNLSKSWGKARDVVPCICGTSIMWVRGPKTHQLTKDGIEKLAKPEVIDRLMLPEELIAVQGFGHKCQEESKWESEEAFMDHDQLSEMAGNMMCGGVLLHLQMALVMSGALCSSIEAMMRLKATGSA